jgi:hypothetical protein
MIFVSSLIEELRTLAPHPLIQRTDILDKTRAILKARIYFGFVDTNILVCAHDRQAGGKHAAAAAYIRALREERRGVRLAPSL